MNPESITMNWDTEPVTEKQLNYLKMFGYESDRPLNKAEAHDLISQFEEDPERRNIRRENQLRESAIYEKERRENLAFYLHKDCDFTAQESAKTKRGDKRDANEELKLCRDARLGFWKDTFREPNARQGEAIQAYGFYDEFGCRFKMPANKQIQPILDALDSNSPTWDKDAPNLFYQTLELNFPELLR